MKPIYIIVGHDHGGTVRTVLEGCYDNKIPAAQEASRLNRRDSEHYRFAVKELKLLRNR